MSGQAQEALKIYERMLGAGAQPTATTYTALISAYGKNGQLNKALQIFQVGRCRGGGGKGRGGGALLRRGGSARACGGCCPGPPTGPAPHKLHPAHSPPFPRPPPARAQDMVRRGCERNVITYSSLISACEKAGRWELALELFREMHTEGCRPNVVTYNSLIAACAQGERALGVCVHGCYACVRACCCWCCRLLKGGPPRARPSSSPLCPPAPHLPAAPTPRPHPSLLRCCRRPVGEGAGAV